MSSSNYYDVLMPVESSKQSTQIECTKSDITELMVSSPDHLMSSPGLSPGQGHYVVFLTTGRHFTLSVTPSTQTSEFNLNPRDNPAMD